MTSLKVCYIAREMISPPIEGNHIISKRITECLENPNIEKHIITIEPGLSKSLFQDYSIVNSRYFADSTGNNALMYALSRVANELVSSINIANRVKQLDCDINHVLNFTKEAYIAAHKLMGIKKPIIVHFYHSPEILKDDIFVFRNIAIKSGFYGRLSDLTILSVNEALANLLVTKYGINPKRVHCVPCPIDTQIFKPNPDKNNLRIKYGLPKNQTIIVYAGSLNTSRGIIELLKSFKIVISEIKDIILYISYPQHNTEKEYEKAVKDLINVLDLKSKVILSGPVTTLQDIFNLADLVILPFNRPYWVDPPLVLLEAMSCGAPVITSSQGAISQLAKNLDNAFIVDPQKIDNFSKAIIQLIKDRKTAYNIGKNARKTIVENYSYPVIGEKLLNIYNSIVE